MYRANLFVITALFAACVVAETELQQHIARHDELFKSVPEETLLQEHRQIDPINVFCGAKQIRRIQTCSCHLMKLRQASFSRKLLNRKDLRTFVRQCSKSFGVKVANTRALCSSFIKKGKLPCRKTVNAVIKLSEKCFGFQTLFRNKKAKGKLC